MVRVTIVFVLSNAPRFCLGLLMILLLGCVHHTPSVEASHAISKHGWVVVELNLDGIRRCLGVFISKNKVLTAHHCVQTASQWLHGDANRITVKTADGVLLRAASVKTVKPRYNTMGDLSGFDLAIIELSKGYFSREPIHIDRHVLEEKVAYALVKRDGQFNAVKVCVMRITPVAIYTEEVTMIGDSGAPLISREGHLLGIASWRSRGLSSRTYSVFNRTDIHFNWIEESKVN